MRNVLGAQRYVFRPHALGENPLSVFGEWDKFVDASTFDRLREATCLCFIDDIRDHDDLDTLVVMRNDWLHFACSDWSGKGLDGFIERAITELGRAEAEDYYGRGRVKSFGLVEVLAESLNWDKLLESIVGSGEA